MLAGKGYPQTAQKFRDGNLDDGTRAVRYDGLSESSGGWKKKPVTKTTHGHLNNLPLPILPATIKMFCEISGKTRKKLKEDIPE